MSGPEGSGSADVVVAVPVAGDMNTGGGGSRGGSGGGSNGGEDLREVAQDPTKQWKVTRTQLAVAALGVAVVAGVCVGLVVGLAGSKPWQQPKAPRRAFAFARFESCKEVQEGFNAKVREGASDSLLTEDGAEPGVRPYSDYWYPHFESDYCDYCNCSGGRSPMQGGPPVMAAMMDDAVPESASMAKAETASGDASAASAGADGGPATAQDYTGTNNQVDGVDEADVIKTDGTYLYVIPRSGASLVISQVFPADAARVLSRVNLTQYNLRASDMLLDKDVLAVIGSSQVRNAAGTLFLSMAAVHLFDVTDRSNPRMKLAYELEGHSLTARLLNGFVYLVVSTWPTYTGWPRRRTSVSAGTNLRMSTSSKVQGGYAGSNNNLALRAFAPLARTLSEREANLATAVPVAVAPVCDCKDISYVKNLGAAMGWISVVAVSTAGGQFDAARSAVEQVGIKTSTHAGRGEAAMMSSQHLYVAATNWDYTMGEWDGSTVDGGQWTVILQFRLNEGVPTFAQLFTVPGTIINQFAMDEYNGHLRVATTWGDMWREPPTSQSNVYVYDAGTGALQGSVEELAPGERIYSVRFMGGMGYLVTFRQVDPLFVLDLSEPKKPVVKGQLKIPGYSEYLHPVTNTLLLGLGRETTQVQGGRTVNLGVKLSLFDVTDPTNPKQVYAHVEGIAGSYSLAAHEHKAFLYHAASGLLVLPMHVRKLSAAQIQRGYQEFDYGQEVEFDGAYIYYVDASSIKMHNKVSHQRKKAKADEWLGFGEGPRQVYRTVYMDGSLLTVSDRELQIHKLATMELQAQLNNTSPQCFPNFNWGSPYPEPYLEEPMFRRAPRR